MNIRLVVLLATMACGMTLACPAAEPAPAPNKLEAFEKYVTKGSPKNAGQVRARARTLTREQVAEFDRRHQGFVNAYTMISRNGHYKLQTDWPLIDALRTADLLDNFTEIFIKHLGIKRQDLLQCQVRLYRNPEEFRRLVASMGLGMGIGGWFRADQCMLVGFWNPDPLYHHETTLIHEATHLVNFLVMRKWNNTNIMPTWLNEGMAVFFESSYMPWARKLDLGRNAFSRLVGLKNTINNPAIPEDKRWTPPAELMNVRGMIPPQCYGESWVIVHYLCYRYGESKRKPFAEFKIFWDRVCQGKISGDYADLSAFVKERSGQTMAQFMNDITAYARELTLPEQYLADGKTKIEWELTLPDPPTTIAATLPPNTPPPTTVTPPPTTTPPPETAKAEPVKPWLIKIKNEDLARADQGDIAMRTMSQLKSGDSAAAALPALTAEAQTFLGPELENRLAKLDLDNREGTISFEGDFLQFDLSESNVPSEAKLKVADIDNVEVSFRIVVDKGSSGIRIRGSRDNPDSGIFLGFGGGTVTFTDLDAMAKAMAAATDDTARAAAQRQFLRVASAPTLKLGQECQLVIKTSGKLVSIHAADKLLATFETSDPQAGTVAFLVAPRSKARIADIKAKTL